VTPPLANYDDKYLCGVSYPDRSLDHDLKRIRKTWEQAQSDRRRDAIYDYLTAVYEIVQAWGVERLAMYRAQRALKLSGLFVSDQTEPFAAVIAASMSPGKLDRRLVSKYSRALRLAAACECRAKKLERFIKERGGLNHCAARFSRRLGRQSKKQKM
jgi:hypothetical protein